MKWTFACAALACAALAGCFRIPQQQNPPPSGGYYGGSAPAGPASYGEPAPAPTGSTYVPPPPAAAPAGPVYVTIRSSCSRTVRVFYGERPKWGSGTYSTVSSNSVSSHSFNPGDMFWIVDDSDNGLSSTSAGPGTREIEILPSCSGFRVN